MQLSYEEELMMVTTICTVVEARYAVSVEVSEDPDAYTFTVFRTNTDFTCEHNVMKWQLSIYSTAVILAPILYATSKLFEQDPITLKKWRK